MRIARLTAIIAVGGVLAGAAVAWSAAAAPPPPPWAAVRINPASRLAASATPPAPASLPAAPASQAVGAPRGVKAKGGVLADAATGTLLWSRGLDTERPIGSITKVMTALIVIRAADLRQKIRVPRAVHGYVRKYGADSAGLRPRDSLTARQLLEALLLPSGSDAAYTLATADGPGMTRFLARMNATAQQLGMAHTHFTSPDGLPYPTEHSTYSTPADLLRLGQAAMKLPVFRTIVGQRTYRLAKGPGHRAYFWQSTNDLIGSYRGADGIKTGYTNAARHCLLFEAKRGGLTLIGAVLGSPVTGPQAGAQDAARVLNWGFGLARP
jgi:serine-type D-Ala-D-Ala carboxypeptidase (penicillin-binding protein 5/6)